MTCKSLLSVFFFICTIFLMISGEITFQKGSPRVKLWKKFEISGKLDYSRDGRPFTSFLGVPYASAKKRFAEAEQITKDNWKEYLKGSGGNEVFEANKPGPFCTQPVSGSLKPIVVGEEDCLNLNIHVPLQSGGGKDDGLPVMIYIHGGSYVYGGGYAYGPKYFMDEDVILVTINYRLSVFGFLSTGDEVISGNWGLKDQVLALKWVQQHIKNFGGDPKKVTIFGESAGGASVHLLYLSQKTEGLFQRAISQSGSALAPWSFHPDPLKNAKKFADYLKCPSTSSEEILTCLRGKSPEALIEALLKFEKVFPSIAFPMHFGPVREPEGPGYFLTEHPRDIIVNKEIPLKNVPWIVGITENEGASVYIGTILQDSEQLEELDSNWNDIFCRAMEIDKFLSEENDKEEQRQIANQVYQFYFRGKEVSKETREILTDVYSDAYFLHSTRKAAVEMAWREHAPVYLYLYSHVGPDTAMRFFGYPVLDEEKKKVGHADDLLMQFNLDGIVPETKDLIMPDSDHETFSKNFIKLWTSFAIHGRPEHSCGDSNEKWEPISKEEVNLSEPLKWYNLKSSGPEVIVKKNFEKRALFWERLQGMYFNFNGPVPNKITKPVKNEL